MSQKRAVNCTLLVCSLSIDHAVWYQAGGGQEKTAEEGREEKGRSSRQEQKGPGGEQLCLA